ncbi:efflux RND transporter permease subunit [Escherichia coli]
MNGLFVARWRTVFGADGRVVSEHLGHWTIINTPVDALPDLSDVQVIIKTSYPGQAPQIVEKSGDLSANHHHVVGARREDCARFLTVWRLLCVCHFRRWHRSVLGAFAGAGVPQPRYRVKLPAGVSAELGPDATGVGWIYEYALVDRSGKHDLADLRSLQDWFLKYELKTIPDVAEVASVGGVVKEYQVVIDPQRTAQYGISLAEVKSALDASNPGSGRFVDRTGGSGIYGALQRLSANARRLLITSF